MAAPASHHWEIYDFSSKNPRTEFNETCQEMTSSKFCFRPIVIKTRWSPWTLIGCDIFYFLSETVEQNSRKLDRQQDLNFLCLVKLWFSGRFNETWKEVDFSGQSLNKKLPPWPIRQKGGTFYSCARYVALWAYFVLNRGEKFDSWSKEPICTCNYVLSRTTYISIFLKALNFSMYQSDDNCNNLVGSLHHPVGFTCFSIIYNLFF